ncbi:MAG: DNA repair protein RecO [candidate division NC10 bacterium]|nr:DNA repair protein RecO [candidate division NC10 bacterium]
MPLHTTEAIVIGGHDLGEVDRIVVFYTEKLGKVRAVASGARRVRSKFGAALLLFTYGRLVFFERVGKGLHRVNEFAILRPFEKLRTDLEVLAHASYLVELLAASTSDEERNEELFHLLLQALGLLEKGHDSFPIARAYEIRLLRSIGYLPELQSCVICRVPLEPATPLAFSPGEGGLVCPDCQSGRKDIYLVSTTALGFLRMALKLSLDRMGRINLPGTSREELVEVLQAYIRHLLHRDLRTLDFLRAYATLWKAR